MDHMIDLPESSPQSSAQRTRRAALETDLRARLLSGEFPVGRRMSMEGLRDHYRVSKQPLTEALRRLAADGIVEIIPQAGCRPVRYTRREMRDFFLVFAGLEGEAAALAAQRRDSADVQALHAALAETATLRGVASPDRRNRGYRLANRRFHDAVHAAARSRMVDMLGRRMWDLSDYMVNSVAPRAGFADHVPARHDEHVAVARAIAAGDADDARGLMSDHIRRTVEIVADGDAAGDVD